jgi:hypothetical protein
MLCEFRLGRGKQPIGAQNKLGQPHLAKDLYIDFEFSNNQSQIAAPH